jgi:O-antigen/teichoic acid export membrane protein
LKAILLNWLNIHVREVLRGAVVSFLVKGSGAVFGFAFNILLARTLGAHGAGVYFLALTVATISSVIARVGLDNTLLRFVAAHASINDWGTVKGVVKKSLSLVLFTSALTAIIVFVSAPWLAGTIFSKPELTLPIRWMALSIPCLSLLMLYAEMLRGLKRILYAEALQGLILPLILILTLYLLAYRWGVSGAEQSYVLATLIAAIFGAWLWRQATVGKAEIDAKFSWRELFDSCIPLYSTSILYQAVMPWLPFLLLGVLGEKDDVGLFGMATRTAYLVSAVLIAVNSIAAPKFAALYKQNKLAELERLAQQTTFMLTLVAIPVTFLMMIFPSQIMAIFGAEFAASGNVLRILLIGQFVNVACGSVGFLLIMSGNEKSFRNAIVLSVVSMSVLLLVLVPHLQEIGAAIANTVAVIVSNVMCIYYVKKRLGISMLPWLKRSNGKTE